MKKTKRILILFFVISIIFYNSYLKAEVISTLDLSGGGTYSYLPGSQDTEEDHSFGGEANLAGSMMFNFDFLKNLWFVPTLTSNYSNTAQPLNIDDERFLFSQWFDIYFSYGANYDFNDNWELRLRGFNRKDLSQQTTDEVFGKGLYDYIDSGFYIENENQFKYYDIPVNFTFGFKYIDRKFPNYTTLLSDLPSEISEYKQSPNTYTKEKDNLTYSFYTYLDFQFGESNWYSYISFIYDYIPYFEQRVIEEDGSLSASKRIDRYITFSIELPYYASENSGVEIDYSLITRITNQNYYDTMGTSSDFSDDKFIKNYYNYYENIIKLALTYEFPEKLFTAYKPIATIGFNFDFIQYQTRYAKNKLGEYKPDIEQDYNYTISLDIKQNITDIWGYYMNIAYTKYSSNMEWEVYGVYNYSYLTATIGTSISF